MRRRPNPYCNGVVGNERPNRTVSVHHRIDGRHRKCGGRLHQSSADRTNKPGATGHCSAGRPGGTYHGAGPPPPSLTPQESVNMKTATSASKVPEEVLKALGLSTLGLLGLLYVALLIVVRGWCIAKLWLWFVVPLGIPAIGVLGAIGLTATVTIALGLNTIKRKGTVLSTLFSTLLATGMLWVVHYFM